jgi:hypothetical protein
LGGNSALHDNYRDDPQLHQINEQLRNEPSLRPPTYRLERMLADGLDLAVSGKEAMAGAGEAWFLVAEFRADGRFNAAKFLIEGVASSDVKQYSFFVETDFAGG